MLDFGEKNKNPLGFVIYGDPHTKQEVAAFRMLRWRTAFCWQLETVNRASQS